MDFVVVDLYTQVDAVNSYVKGWDRSQILAWLQRFGEVMGPFDLEGSKTWVFRSACALTAGFYFSEQNEIVVPGRKRRARIRIRANSRMRALFNSWKLDIEDVPSFVALSALKGLPTALYQHGSIYSISPEEPAQEDISRQIDETGYECSVNHVHVESPVGHTQDPVTFAAVGVVYAHRLARLLQAEFPGTPFRIIVGYNPGDSPSCIVRFHKLRAGEEWLAEDLETYLEEAILVMDVEPD